MNRRVSLSLCLLLMAQSHQVQSQQPDPNEVLELESNYQQDAQASQEAVEELDNETISMISSYNRELERYEDLVTYNENMRELIASQEAEKARINRELDEVAVVQQELVPLMVEMVDVLGQFITLDKPILLEERTSRLETLESILNRSDVEMSEKYRRIIEAYQIEAEYGQSLEAYESQIELQGREVTVDLLRVGRVALYYLGLDRQSAGIWDDAAKQWVPLASEFVDDLDYAVRVAREQAPPNLIDLPLWTQEG